MRFGIRLNRKRILLLLMIASVVTSLLRSWVADSLRMPANYALAPVGDFVTAATSAFKSAVSDRAEAPISAEDLKTLRKELEVARGEANARAMGQRVWMERCYEIQRTRSKLYGRDQRALTMCELIPVRVILGEALPYGQSRTISQGTIHGVEPGMRVVEVFTDRSKAFPPDARMRVITGTSPISAKHIPGSVLLGWVEASGSFVARVRLVTDKRFKISAAIERCVDPNNPRRALLDSPHGRIERVLTKKSKWVTVTLSGDGGKGMVTDKIYKHHSVREGDWLWSVKLTAKLPVKLRIGQVTRVEPAEDSPNFVVVHVSPAADLEALRELFIVRPLLSKLPPRPGRPKP